MLQEKVPASFLHLEKLLVSMTDEFRARNEEPIVRMDALWARSNEDLQQKRIKPSQSTASLGSTSGAEKQLSAGELGSHLQTHAATAARQAFRDRLEFRQAVQFLQENGVVVAFDDTQLRDFCFIDPPWLYTVLRAVFAGSAQKASTASGAPSPALPILPTAELFQRLKANLGRRSMNINYDLYISS